MPLEQETCWNDGEDFPGLNEILELAQPENIVKASNESLCEHIVPRTVDHITPENVNTLRVCAKRVLKQS